MKISNTKNSLSMVKVKILHHLHKIGRTKVLDLEMALSRGNLRGPLIQIQAALATLTKQEAKS